MTLEEVNQLIQNQQFATIGFLDRENIPSIRRVFCTWHKGIGTHLISTNTSSLHVQELIKKPQASLYFEDSNLFEGVCLTGEFIVHFDHEHKALLWHDSDVKYYSKGVDDEDYCILEFKASRGRYYRYDGKGEISKDEIVQFDRDRTMTNYSK